MKHLAMALLAMRVVAAQPEAARDLSNRGLEAYDRGDVAEAERDYRQAIAQWVALGAAYAPHLGVTRMNLGESLAAEGRRDEALPELRQAAALLRASLGVRDLHTLVALNLLAGLELMMGDVRAAAALVDEALPVAREIDPAGVQMARALDVLACLRLRQNRLEEALPLADEALRLAIQAAGPESLDAALTYATAAEVHRAAGRNDRALPLYRRARLIYEKKAGPQDLRIAALLAQESLLLADDRKFALAEEQLQRASAILDRACPSCALERRTVESAFGTLRARQGRYAEADRYFTHVLELEEAARPQPGDELAGTLNALAFVRRKEHRLEDAERLSHRAATLALTLR